MTQLVSKVKEWDFPRSASGRVPGRHRPRGGERAPEARARGPRDPAGVQRAGAEHHGLD